MTDPTARALELLGVLQMGGAHSGPMLAACLGVTDRTLRRDIARLRELGYGLEGGRGSAGGYRLAAGGQVPPLVLAPDEAVAIAVGLRSAATGAVGGLQEAAITALAKLEHSLSSEARERIGGLSRSMVGLDPVADIDLDALVTTARAIRERRGMRIRYRRHDGTEGEREVEPHRIVHTASRWYVLAFSPEQLAWRTYRLDRLEPRLPLGRVFAERRIPDAAVQEFANHAIATAPYRVECRVIMHAPLADVRRIYGPQITEARAIDALSTELTFGADDLDVAAVYLGNAGVAFEVVSPPALLASLELLGERMLAAARGPAGVGWPLRRPDAAPRAAAAPHARARGGSLPP